MKTMISRVTTFVLLALITPWLVGCCCCGRLPSNLNIDGGAPNDVTPIDPKASQEEIDARKYATQALAKKGYGAAKTSSLRKSDQNWYVSGTAGGKDGGDVEYEIWYFVDEFRTENEIRQQWAVRSISINGDVVFP